MELAFPTTKNAELQPSPVFRFLTGYSISRSLIIYFIIPPYFDVQYAIHFMQSQLYKKCAVYLTITWCKSTITERTERGNRDIKTKIRELRKKRRISQEELAKALHVTRHTITSIENEKYTASLPLAYKIAKFFGMTIEEVFDFSDVGVIDYEIFS
jgi:putative transcriptional regulator